MAQGWRQYLEAGMHVGEMTRAQAQRLVRQLVKEGQLAEDRARSFVDELVTRSRKRTDELAALVRREVASQLSALGLATKDDLARLERKLTKAAKAQPAAKSGASAGRKRPTKAPAKGSKTSKASKGTAKSSRPASGGSRSGSK